MVQKKGATAGFSNTTMTHFNVSRGPAQNKYQSILLKRGLYVNLKMTFDTFQLSCH